METSFRKWLEEQDYRQTFSWVESFEKDFQQKIRDTSRFVSSFKYQGIIDSLKMGNIRFNDVSLEEKLRNLHDMIRRDKNKVTGTAEMALNSLELVVDRYYRIAGYGNVAAAA